MPTITVLDKPSAPNLSSNQTPSGSSARERAISALLGSGQQTGAPATQVNQTTAPVETLAAISDQTPKSDQINTNEIQIKDAELKSEATDAPPEEPLSKQYAIIARREKALRAKAVAQEQAFKAREAALIAREAEIQSKSAQDLNNYISKDDLKRNPYGVLSQLGVSYDQISQQALQAQSPEYQTILEMRQEMEKELQKVREEQANTRKSFEQQQAESYQQALKQIEMEARQLVNTDPSFEMIRETKQVNEVVKLIERTFKEDGELLSVERAAELVEDAIAEEALKVSRIGKIQKRLQAATQSKGNTAAAAPAKTATENSQPQNLTTLTNKVASTRPLSARERALLAFKGELK